MKDYTKYIEKIQDSSLINWQNLSDAHLKQPLVLALVGDSVHSLSLRTRLAKTCDLNAHDITLLVNKMVNASAQAKAFRFVENILTEEEKAVANRARNTHTHSTAKNFSVLDYRYATAFEALLGYLYLTKNQERIDYILDMVCKDFLKNIKN